MNRDIALDKMDEILCEADEVRSWLKDGVIVWSNEACLGYAAHAMEWEGIDADTVQRITDRMERMMENKFPYEMADWWQSH